MAEPRVAAIVLNYKTPLDTIEAVASLKGTAYENLDIIVVDNASHDGLGERLSREHPDVLFLENRENLGFPGGCNVGIREGLRRDAEYILLLNSDATATPDLLKNLIGVAESQPGLGVLGPTVLLAGGPEAWFQGGTLNRPFGYTRHPGMGMRPSSADRLIPTDFVTGAAMLIRREVFERVGPLEEDYFLYMDDVDFCERAQRAGFMIAVSPRAVARHKVSASAGVRGSNVMTPLRAYYFARNMVIFIRRHIHGWRKWTALQGQIYVRAVYRLWTMMLDRQSQSVAPYLRGLWHGFMGITGKWSEHDRWTPM